MTSYTYTGPADRCCSKCTASLIEIPTSNARCSVKVVQAAKWILDVVKSELIQWRESKAAEILPLTRHAPNNTIILPDLAIRCISWTAATIHSMESLAYAAQGKWAFLYEYGDEVLEVIRNAYSQATPPSSVRPLARTRIWHPLADLDPNSGSQTGLKRPRYQNWAVHHALSIGQRSLLVYRVTLMDLLALRK